MDQLAEFFDFEKISAAKTFGQALIEILVRATIAGIFLYFVKRPAKFLAGLPLNFTRRMINGKLELIILDQVMKTEEGKKLLKDTTTSISRITRRLLDLEILYNASEANADKLKMKVDVLNERLKKVNFRAGKDGEVDFTIG